MTMEDEDERRVRIADLILRLRRTGITDQRVLGAIELVPRDVFVPAESRADAYAERALPIDCGQTISAPLIVGMMTGARPRRPRPRARDRHRHRLPGGDPVEALPAGLHDRDPCRAAPAGHRAVQPAGPQQHHRDSGRRHARLAGIPAVRSHHRHRQAQARPRPNSSINSPHPVSW